MRDFRQKSNRCVDYAVTELRIPIDISLVSQFIFVLAVEEDLIYIHLDNVSLDQPLKRLVNVLNSKAAYKVVSTAIWHERDG